MSKTAVDCTAAPLRSVSSLQLGLLSNPVPIYDLFQNGLSKLQWNDDSTVTRSLTVQMQSRRAFHFNQSLISKREKPMTWTCTLILRFLTFTHAQRGASTAK